MSDDINNVVQIPRDHKGRFPKGVSGNPSGGSQPKTGAGDASKKDHTAYFRSKVRRVADQLLAIIEDPHAPAGARVSAAKAWIEQGFGKPAITVPAPDEAQYEGLDVDQLSEETLADIVRASAKEKRG